MSFCILHTTVGQFRVSYTSLSRMLTIAMNMVIRVRNHGHDIVRQIVIPLIALSNERSVNLVRSLPDGI